MGPDSLLLDYCGLHFNRKGFPMRFFKLVCLGLVALSMAAYAEKSTYSVLSIGAALPASKTAGLVLPIDAGNTKELNTGWEAKWTLFGFPFKKANPVLSGLAFGGQVSYNRWVRDSTLSEVTFLGLQGVARYYIPPVILDTKPFGLFVQAGCGMFIGEHSFTDADTISRNHLPEPAHILINKGIKKMGASFNIGIDWDVLEVSPGVTVVFTAPKPSTWLSLDAAMKF